MHIKSQEYLLQRIKGGSLKGVVSVRETWRNICNISVFIHLKRIHSSFYDKSYMPEGAFTQLKIKLTRIKLVISFIEIFCQHAIMN